jgi:hypothetical protein
MIRARERLLGRPVIILRIDVVVVPAVRQHDSPGTIWPKVAGRCVDGSLERGRHWSGVKQPSRHAVERDLHTR